MEEFNELSHQQDIIDQQRKRIEAVPIDVNVVKNTESPSHPKLNTRSKIWKKPHLKISKKRRGRLNEKKKKSIVENFYEYEPELATDDQLNQFYIDKQQQKQRKRRQTELENLGPTLYSPRKKRSSNKKLLY